MTERADLVTTVLARELLAAHTDEGVDVFAVTTPLTMAAGLAARRLGAEELAIAVGFCILDAVDPTPALTLGEWALGVDGAVSGPPADTFVALMQGRVGVAASPAQVDGRGAANLSRAGGSDDRPGVALPGSRGLPDNLDSPSRVWYLLTDHSPRRLVHEVDFVSGPPPSRGRRRVMITPLGVFDLEPGSGFRARSLTRGVTAAGLDGATGFPVAGTQDAPATEPPTDRERETLETADPEGLRTLPFLSGDDAAELSAHVAESEARQLPGRG